MAQVAEKTLNQEEVLEPSILPITTKQYHQMAEMGMFEGKRVQLINGYVIRMAAMNDPHFSALRRLDKLFDRYFENAGIAEVSQQSPIRVTKSESDPEPDFALIKSELDKGTAFASSDVFLVVEISDSTLKLDQSDKLAVYAKEGIPEYWILNLKSNQLEVYREPDPENAQYLSRTILKQGQAVACATFPAIPIEWW